MRSSFDFLMLKLCFYAPLPACSSPSRISLFYRQGAPESNLFDLPTFAFKWILVIDPVLPSVPLELSSYTVLSAKPEDNVCFYLLVCALFNL